MRLLILSLTFLFITTPQVALARLPKGCKRLKSGRLKCRLKGRKRRIRKSYKKKNRWPWKKLRRFKRPLSLGLPWEGKLHRGRKIPFRGKGYIVVPRTIARGNYYGLPELIGLIKRAAARVYKSYKGSKLTIADLSARFGGKVAGHKSHQSGRDVDIGFFLLNKHNKFRVSKKYFIPMDSKAVGLYPNNHLIFDLERNWELVETLITDKKTKVIRIFVSADMRALLLNYAAAILRPQWIIKKASIIMKHYPHHNDHFHVRISCPKHQIFCNRPGMN